VSTLYFETSAFVKLLVTEPGSQTAVQAWVGGFQMSASPLLFVEARASLAAARRARRMTGNGFSTAKGRLTAMRAEIHEVEVDPALLARAEELAEQEALRGYDAVHLASSLFAGVDVLVTADAALIDAGRRCGLTVIDARS
jgi:predicted nucleic acid-binding protein